MSLGSVRWLLADGQSINGAYCLDVGDVDDIMAGGRNGPIFVRYGFFLEAKS